MEDDRSEQNETARITGLQWKELFERTPICDRGIHLKSVLVPQLKHGAVSSHRIVENPVLSICLHEDRIQELVLSPLEWFLFGEEPVSARRKLAEVNNPATLCGKVFKNGEPTYSCRDCALDGTCVLCMTCFGKSIHKDHNYRLSTSGGGGGGCCDCGDVEAWKQGAACELHTVKPGSSVEEDPLKNLSQDFIDRVQCLFTILLDYCVNLICQPNDNELFPELKASLMSDDSYVTIVYNDESHTFDGVISSFVASISGCSEYLAKHFAAVVDREGRSTVCLGTLELCERVRTSIQHSTKRSSNAGPLRCETFHFHLITCQLLALRITKWLSDLTAESDSLRRIHSILSTSSSNGRLSHLTQVLHADAKLWKAARIHTHQLFMSTLLKDTQGRITFGIEFTKNYPILMKDFHADDQEHSISATAMSVQVFTVPSLVQMLVVNYDLLEVVTGALLELTKCFLADNGLFDFHKSRSKTLSRIYYIVHDLRYILQHKPSEWSGIFKDKFFRFLELFLSFCRRFQGMASTKRATGIHVETEPDMQRDIDFELRIAHVLPLITTWCEHDRDVLRRSVSLTLGCLMDIRKKQGGTKLKEHHESKKSLKIFKFDVSSERISIHIPIVRFLAGLIGYCEKHSINIQDLLKIKKEDDILMYLEYPLKVLVFVAQVKAGMWKKNGFSILGQVRVYRNDLTGAMYDKDIFLMQVLASCMDKDHFFTIILDMFKLSSWATQKFSVDKMDETTLAQQLALAGEFLHLLIVILGERYSCHVGQVNSDSQLRRDVIHSLCLGTMPRSELMRGLPLLESEYERDGRIDDIILSVATFKKPGLSSKGLYKLKREYFSEFNPFFYHYSKNEQSKAENHQRMMCKEEGIPADVLEEFLESLRENSIPEKTKKATKYGMKIFNVFVPPVPVDFCPGLSNVVDLLSCKKMVELLTVILWRIKESNPKSWTDRIFQEALHLIGLALHEETRQREKQKSFGFLNAATKCWTSVCKHSLLDCLEFVQGNSIVEGHSGLLRWTINKFNNELAARQHSNNTRAEKTTSEALEVSLEDSGVTNDESKFKKQRLAKERRDKVLLQMSNMQKAFIRENSELYLSTNYDETDYIDAVADAFPGRVSAPVIAIGNNRTASVVVPAEQFTCILCQEKQTVTSDERPLVFSALIQRSTVLTTVHGQEFEEGDSADPLVSPRDHRLGVHMSSCGHVMHGDCWQRFFESMATNERLSLRLRIQTTIDMTKREFLCPLCRGLGNAVLPMLSPTVPSQEARNQGFVSWLTSLRKIEMKITKELIDFSQTSKPADNLLMSLLKGKILPFFRMQISVDMNSMINLFSQAAFTAGLNAQPDEDDHRVPLMVWATCAYTIQCFENSSRDEAKALVESLPKREFGVLKSLIYLANSISSISKQPDLLNYCLRLLSVFIGCANLPDEQRSLMEVDLFDWMVKMRFCLPSMDSQGGSSSLYGDGETSNLSSLELDMLVFHLGLAGTMTQIMLTTSADIDTDEMDETDEQEVAKQLSNLWGKLKALCSPNSVSSCHPFPQRLLHHVQYRLLPFLRCSAMFFHILNSTRLPVALTENFISLGKEYRALSEYLALPENLADIFGWNDEMKIFNDSLMTRILTRWCSNCDVGDCTETFSSLSLEPRRLIELPNDYSELISQASDFHCPVISGQENLVPAKCLVCGQMLCCEAFCCVKTVGGRRVGSCTAHALTCGAGIGIFLRIRDCMLLLINGVGKGCFYPPPYLDAYGETDPGLRRGNPLYLCHERYSRLQKLWRQHAIASEIVRYLEINRQVMTIDWANY